MEDKFHLGIKALITNNSKEILLLKVNINALRGYNGEPYWDIPGGRIQVGDTVEDTLVREIEEEIGVKEISGVKPVNMVLSNIRIPLENEDVGLILSVYECKISENAQIKLSAEHSEYAWFSAKEAAKLLEFKYPKEFTKAIYD